jgi:hypothetical protein
MIGVQCFIDMTFTRRASVHRSVNKSVTFRSHEQEKIAPLNLRQQII